MPVPERPVLVAPDSFKGTFSAPQVAGAIGRGLERAGLMPPDLCPVADGGEGTLDALLPQLGGELVAVEVRDPLGRPVRAGFGLVEDGGTALVEMAGGGGLRGAGLVVLCDVRTVFEDAPRVFGPQKGAGRELVTRLERRL